jgi:hypothetical protein
LPAPGVEITYDWPDGGGGPFDASADETRWVLVAGKRFGRTWPAGDRRDFGSRDPDFQRRVPMGYKVIQVVERLAVVDDGRVVREWPESNEVRPRPVFDPYQRHVPGSGSSGTYAVLDGQGSRRLPDGSWEKHEHDSYAAALAEAVGMDERRVLVGRLIETRDWH